MKDFLYYLFSIFFILSQIDAQDLCRIDFKIPEQSIIPHQNAAATAIRENRPREEILELLRQIPRGNIKIKSFEFNSVRYQLFESPVTEASGIVNFWSSTKVESGQLARGKPFARYFVVIADSLSVSASYALGPIPKMPTGFNRPFSLNTIEMPLGLDNPYISKPEHIRNTMTTTLAATNAGISGVESKKEKKEKKEKSSSVATVEATASTSVKKEKKDKSDKEPKVKKEKK